MSVSVFIASASPLDQFIMNDTGWFFGKSAEEGRIDPDNPYILTDHVKCASFELPFSDEAIGQGADPFEAAADVLSCLEEDGVVRHTAGRWHWADRSFPAEGISLRSAASDNVVIVDLTGGRDQVIGEMDRPSAREMLFVNAVYLHRGRQYLVEKLDIENRICQVREADVNYFTDGLVKTDIKVLTEDEWFSYPQGVQDLVLDAEEPDASGPDAGECNARGVLSDVLVRSQVSKFKKLRFRTHENIGYGDIDLAEEEMQTRSAVFLFGPGTLAGEFLKTLKVENTGSVLSGAGTLIRTIAPVFLLCDSRDLGIAERVRDPHFGIPALYVYDKYPGGTGLSEALVRKAPLLFRTILKTIERCPCRAGCPSCVGPGADKEGTRNFLKVLGNSGA
jgi:DEAD/DEAH box helicase domain-containing protein